MSLDIFNNLLLINWSVIVSICVGGSILLLMYITYNLRLDNVEKVKNATKSCVKEKVKGGECLLPTNVINNKCLNKAAGGNKKSYENHRWMQRSDKHNTFTHPWLLTSLKGHTGQILDMDFSNTGKYLASCADDRTVMLWCTKDLTQKDHKNLRVNIDFDFATFVKWSPDNKAVVVHKHTENIAEVYKFDKKSNWFSSPTKALSFPKVQEEDVVGMGIACNGRFIMTCSEKNNLVLWDLKGHELARLDTCLMNSWCAKISPCGRFIVASGFAPDVKVWEVCFSKNGDFLHVKRAFELCGHTSGVYDFAFDTDTSHIATVSKDGSWKLFDTKIEYTKGEDPHLKITAKYKNSGSKAHIALSPNSEVVVISVDDTLNFFSTSNGTLDQTIQNIYSGNPITALLFDSMGKYILTSGGKHVRVFHNVTGYKCNIATAKEKLKQNQTSATKERLENIIAESKAFIDSIPK